MSFFIKTIKNNFFPFLYSTTLTGSAIFLYFSIKVSKNNAKYLKLKNDEDNTKDTTRSEYEFYGINWGAASDKMVFLTYLK